MNARQKIDKLIIEHQKEFGFHSNFDFMNELLAEIEEERDEFAAGYVVFCSQHNNDVNFGRAKQMTTDQLLEQYKKTL